MRGTWLPVSLERLRTIRGKNDIGLPERTDRGRFNRNGYLLSESVTSFGGRPLGGSVRFELDVVAGVAAR